MSSGGRDDPCWGSVWAARSSSIDPRSAAPAASVSWPEPSSVSPPSPGERYPTWAGTGFFDGIADGAFFYFVHSYYPQPAKAEVVIGECEYGPRFAAAVARDNLAACQFHPEKSAENGLRLLANFLGWKP